MVIDTPGSFSIPDPRPRVVSFALLVAAAMTVLPGIGPMALVLAYVLALFLAARRPARELRVHARRLLPFVIVVVVLNGWLVRGSEAVTIAGRPILSRDGLVLGVYFSLRLCVLYLASAVLVATTPPEEFAAAVFAFTRPFSQRLARRLAFYGFVTISFIPLFADEARRVRLAQWFRGGGLSGGFFERVRSARSLLVPLIVSAIRRSEQLAMVTELRGLEERLGRSLVLRRARGADGALPVITLVVVLAAALVWR